MLPEALQQLKELVALHDVAVDGYVGLPLQFKGVMETLIQSPKERKHQQSAESTAAGCFVEKGQHALSGHKPSVADERAALLLQII